MKKNYSFYLTLLLIPMLAFLFLGLSGGRDGQYSGSPGDGGTTCTACHSGGDFGAVAEITTNIPTSGFVYGDIYEITVSVTSSSSKHGFQLTTEDPSQAKVGSYTAGVGNQVVNAGTHMTHTSAGNSQTSWTFDWTAPESIVGDEITFYAAVNSTNGNGSTSGDQIVTTSLTYPLSTVGVFDNENISLAIYPNPTADYINIDSNESFVDAVLMIADVSGKIVLESNKIDSKIDIRNLIPGTYILHISSDNKSYQSKFIKN